MQRQFEVFVDRRYERLAGLSNGRLYRRSNDNALVECKNAAGNGRAQQRGATGEPVRHWIDGGETRLGNLVLLCSAHHRLLHHGVFHIAVEYDDVVFISRDGEVIEPVLRPQFAEVPAGVSEETPLPGPGAAGRTNPSRTAPGDAATLRIGQRFQ